MKKFAAIVVLILIQGAGWFSLSGIAAAAEPPVVPHLKNVKVTILSTMLADKGLGEWGFSALIEADGYRVLFDTGARPETVLQNAAELHVDLSQVNDVILSHFHDDHTGGLLTLRKAMMKKNPQALSRVLVGAGIFEPRYEPKGTANVNPMPALRKQMEATGARFVVFPQAAQISPGIWLTGPVKRRYPEHNWSDGLLVDGPSGKIEDNIQEDMSLVINTDDGLIIVTGCGHAGIGNILAQSRDMLPNTPVKAVVGGLHLFEASDSTLEWTADRLRESGVRYLLAAHCTGLEATYRLRALLKLDRSRAVVAAVGSSYSSLTGIDPLALAR